MRQILTIMVLSIFILSGCATNNIAKTYSFDKPNQNGIIIGSLTRTKSPKGYQLLSALVSKIKVYYCEIESKKCSYIEMDPLMLGILYPSDFNGIDGKLFVIELKPGNYRFNTWNAMQGGHTYITPNNQFSLPFKVKKNEINYIGELNLDFIFVKNIFGMGIVSDADFTVKDSFDRDIKIIKKEYQNINVEKINQIVIN